MRRRVVAAALLLSLTGAAAAATGATTPAPTTGVATSVVTLPTVTVTDATGVAHTVSLGALSAAAQTAGDTVARLALGGGAVAETALPDWSSSTSDGEESGDHSVPVSSSLATGGVTLAGYDVAAGAGVARASLGALTGSLAADIAGATATLGTNGLSAGTTSDLATATGTLDVAGADISVGALLPVDVLDALPLSQLLAFVQALHQTVPSDALAAMSQLASLSTLLAQLRSTAAALSDAQQQLDALLSSNSSTQAAQQTLDAAQQQLTTDLAQLAAAQQQLAQDQATVQSLQTQVAAATAAVASAQSAYDAATATVNDLQAQLAADPLSLVLQQQLTIALATQAQDQQQLTAAQSQLTSLQQQLAAATAQVATDQQTVTTLQQTVAAAQSTVDADQATLDAQVAALAAGNATVAAAQSAVDALESTLTSQLSTITADVSALPDLQTVRSELAGIVSSAPLADMGTVTLGVDARADQAGGSGTVSCSLVGLSVLGTAVPTASCADARQGFASAVTSLQAALAAVPGAPTPPSPVLDGLVADSSGAAALPQDATTHATASLTPLRLALPSLSLHAVTDPLVTSLNTVLGQVTASLSTLALPAGSAALTGSLGTLSAAVAALPTGAALDGLRTLGFDVSLVGLSATTTHYRLLPAGTSGSGSAGAPTPDPTPTGSQQSSTPATSGSAHSPDPSSPSGGGDAARSSRPDRRLPFSGSDSAADIAVALIALLGGIHLTIAGRRRRTDSVALDGCD